MFSPLIFVKQTGTDGNIRCFLCGGKDDSIKLVKEYILIFLYLNLVLIVR